MREVLDLVERGELKITKPHYLSYLAWMRRKVTETRTISSVQHPEIDMKCYDLYDSVESHNAQGKLYMTIGRSLVDILGGKADPLQLMFDGDLVANYYEACNREVLCNQPLHRYLELVSHKNPNLNIIEVGAGTGAATTSIVKALTNGQEDVRFASYDYTDVSPGFFGAAEIQYAHLSNT
jgi:hypothetical protein